jgi:hypothetical protein
VVLISLSWRVRSISMPAVTPRMPSYLPPCACVSFVTCT